MDEDGIIGCQCRLQQPLGTWNPSEQHQQWLGFEKHSSFSKSKGNKQMPGGVQKLVSGAHVKGFMETSRNISKAFLRGNGFSTYEVQFHNLNIILMFQDGGKQG